MAGASYRVDWADGPARRALSGAALALANPQRLYRDIGEGLLPRWRNRFTTQTDPAGNPWQPLSKRYQRTKKYNQDRVLTLRGFLGQRSLAYQALGDGLQIGSTSKTAAIHNFGGEIQINARSQFLYFHQRKSGEVGNRFVSKKRSNFAYRVEFKAYTITMPKRQFIGLSASDEDYIIETATGYLTRALNP